MAASRAFFVAAIQLPHALCPMAARHDWPQPVLPHGEQTGLLHASLHAAGPYTLCHMAASKPLFIAASEPLFMAASQAFFMAASRISPLHALPHGCQPRLMCEDAMCEQRQLGHVRLVAEAQPQVRHVCLLLGGVKQSRGVVNSPQPGCAPDLNVVAARLLCPRPLNHTARPLRPCARNYT